MSDDVQVLNDRWGMIESGMRRAAEMTVKDVAEYLGVTEKTVRNRAKEHGGYWMDEGAIGRKAAS